MQPVPPAGPSGLCLLPGHPCVSLRLTLTLDNNASAATKCMCHRRTVSHPLSHVSVKKNGKSSVPVDCPISASFPLLFCLCLLACPGPRHLVREVPSQTVRLLGFSHNPSGFFCPVERMFVPSSLLVRTGPRGWRKQLVPSPVI